MSKVLEVSSNNFDSVILRADCPVLVDFWAPWCGPCKSLAPTIERLAEDYAGRALVAKFNVDNAKEMYERFGFRSIPTLLFFKNGDVQHRLTGAQPMGRYKEIFDSMLGDTDSEVASRVVAEVELARALQSREIQALDEMLRGNPELIRETVEVRGLKVQPISFLLATSEFEKLKVLLNHGGSVSAHDLDTARDIKNQLDFIETLLGSASVEKLVRLLDSQPYLADKSINVRGQEGRPLTFLLAMGQLEKAEAVARYVNEISVIELAGLGRLAELKSRFDNNPELLTEAVEDGLSALALAARNGQLDVGSWILEAESGFGKEARAKDTVSPMDCAIEGGHLDFMELLIRHGESLSFTDPRGIPHLFMATIRNNARLVKWLVHHGDDPNSQLPNGKTIIEIAQKDGHEEIHAFLTQASAKSLA